MPGQGSNPKLRHLGEKMKIEFDDTVIEHVMIQGLQKELKGIKELLKIHSQTRFDNGDSFLIREMHDEDTQYYRKLKAAMKLVLQHYVA
jgi:hypothetical protein